MFKKATIWTGLMLHQSNIGPKVKSVYAIITKLILYPNM